MSILPRSSFRMVLIAVLSLFSAMEPVVAQTLYGTVVGLVVDASGCAVPNVKLTITNKGTGLTLETMTDPGGSFTILNVPAGTYDAKAALAGFKTQSRTDLAATVNIPALLPFSRNHLPGYELWVFRLLQYFHVYDLATLAF